MVPKRPDEPLEERYRFRKRLLVQARSASSEKVASVLLQAAFDRYRISAWCGNEDRGHKDAIAILETVLATQGLDSEPQGIIRLVIDGLNTLKPSRRFEEIMLRWEGLMPADWPGWGDHDPK